MLSPAILLAAIFTVFPAPAGKSAHARLASVESRVAPLKLAIVDPEAELRRDLESQLGAIDWKAERVSSPFVLSAVLSDAESTTGGASVRASCTVRVMIREPSGAILGTVSGFAKGEDAKGARASLERGVLEAASASASKAIPDAVRRARAAR